MSSTKRNTPSSLKSKYFAEPEDQIIEKTKEKKVRKTIQKRSISTKIPDQFATYYSLIKEMRSKRNAAVDTSGSECCADTNAEPRVFRYQTLIALMLSSQTRDEITAKTMYILRDYGLTPEHIKQTSIEDLQQLLKPVGFYVKKADYVKRTTDLLLNEYGGDIPNTIGELVKLPGVGPKMGYLTLKVAWNKIDGIGVDVHLHRICNRLQWVKSDTPEQTRIQLEAWLPREYWSEVNLLLVGFGQQICSSKPKCTDCKLREMCPASEFNSKDIEDSYRVCLICKSRCIE